MEFLKKHRFYLGFFIGVLVSIGIVYWLQPGKPFPDLAAWGVFAELITAMSVGIAVLNYRQQKSNDDTRLIYDLLEDFKSIEKDRTKIRREIEEVTPEYFNDSQLSPISEMSLSNYIKEYPQQAASQFTLFTTSDPRASDILSDLKLLLKALEGFSAVIVNAGLEDHPLLLSIRSSFAVLVEQHAIYILMMTSTEKSEAYGCLTNLYHKWKSEVGRDLDRLKRELRQAGVDLGLGGIQVQGGPVEIL